MANDLPSKWKGTYAPSIIRARVGRWLLLYWRWRPSSRRRGCGAIASLTEVAWGAYRDAGRGGDCRKRQTAGLARRSYGHRRN